MEEKQLRVEMVLKKCSQAELENISEGLKLPEENWKGQREEVIFRRLQAVFDEIEDDEAKYKKLLEILPIAPLVYSDELMKILMKKPKIETPVVERKLSIDSTSKFRREFKIIGNIGADDDSLEYISLCSQIAEGKAKGYTEEEIAAAVRKACSSTTNLRTYLDAKLELPLESVLSFIRSFMREKSATELFQELNSAVQKECETALTFVIRAMKLREQVIEASEAENSMKYNQELVQSLFLHAVRTGLSDDSVRTRMEPLLKKDVMMGDERLIAELNVVASEETERKLKREKIVEKKCIRVAEANVNVQELMNPLVETVKLMSEEIKSLREEMGSMKNKSKRWTPKKRGCDYCRLKKKESDCRHCWNCGAGDHMSYNCEKKKEN